MDGTCSTRGNGCEKCIKYFGRKTREATTRITQA
jgi:hypothetical protein